MTLKKYLTVVLLFLFFTSVNAQLSATFIGDASDLGNDCYQITPNLNTQVGGVWLDNAIDLTNDFVISVNANFGSNDANGADGMALILKDTPTPELGNPGGGIGYEGITPSLAIEFDTWQNGDESDPVFDHIAILSNGNVNHSNANNLAGPIQASSTSINIEDGIDHEVKVVWESATNTLSVFFDCNERLSFVGDISNTLFGGNTNIFLGFNGSTGGSTNVHQVCIEYLTTDNFLSLPNQNICTGESLNTVDATLTGTYTYSWSPIAGVSNPNIPNPSFSPTTTTTYTVAITDSCGAFIANESFTLSVENPTISPTTDMELCDDISNNGFETFDLTTQDADILGPLSALDYNVSYHLNFTDADNNANPLPDLYENIASPQPIFVRIQSINIPTCYSVSSTAVFQLIVNPRDDATFSITPNCNGGTVSITGTTGGTFSFITLPTDGAAIDTMSGEVTNATSGASYFIQYITPAGICPSSSVEELIVLVTDDSSFTMTPTCDGGTATITGTTGGSFAFNPVPTDSASIDTNTGTITNGTSGATYTVEYTTTGVCPAISSQDVIVFPAENADFTTTATCDGGTVTVTGDTGGVFALSPDLGDGAVIDTTTGTITGGSSGVTYTIAYTTVGPCSVFTEQDVTVITSDDASFTITSNCSGGIMTVTGTAGGTFTFNPLPGDSATIDSTTGEVINGTSGASYTIQYTTSGVCFDSNTEVLNVLSIDDAAFTLTPNCDGATATITGLAGGTFTFNPIPTDGATIDAATGEITTGNPGTNYTVDYTTNGTCVATSTESVTVNNLPVVTAPTPLSVCDDGTPDGITAIDLTIKNSEISGGNPDYIVTYYISLLDAENATNPLPIPYTNTTPNTQQIFVRVVDVNTGCFDTTTLTLQVEQAPVACTPTALEYCDPDSDGFGEFDLTLADNEIACGAMGLNVTYHETMADAENNINAITGIYNNIVVNMQTIYVRIESSTIATDCASFVELQLIVNPTPQITDPTPLEVCDNDADGFATFDLTVKEPEILNLLDADATNDLDPTQYIVSYYISEANAIAGTNPIATPNAFVNTIIDTQTIWIRVTDNTNTCATVRPLVLIVNPLPVLVQPAPLELCDVNNPGDEVEEFNLEDANAQILNGQTGITLSYYLTQGDADLGVNPLPTLYTNIVNAQTIYVRAAINTTGCYDTITLDLRVNPIPSPIAMPVVYQECDDDNDGFAAFDLDSQSATIINGEPGITVKYFETMEDAQSMTNPLVSPYNNIVASMQIIYVVVTNTGTMTTPATGCFTIVELPLEVLPAPVVDLEADLITDGYVICDTDGDGFAQFDFDTVITPDVYDAQDPADFVLTYHVTQADADTGNNPITNTSNYTNVSNPQTIYIRLESLINGCVTTTASFQIIVSLPPVINPAYDNELSQCDDLDANYYEANDGVTAFDLTVEDAEIVNGNTSWVVVYYETMVDAQAGTNPIVDPTNYTNIATPQTVYVSVTDADTSCSSYTTVTIRVLPNPSPSPNPVDLELCDDNDVLGTGPNDLAEIFDLTQNETFIINGEVGVSASYYTNQADAITGTNAIVDPTMHINEDPDNPGVALTPQTIYVRLTNGDDTTGLNGTGCFTLVNFDVIVNPLPVVTPVDDYTHCEFNTDGVYESFDFTTMTDAILNGQDPTVFTVTYHETQAEADTSMNDLIPSGLYTNTSNPQTIYVNITNTVTGCFTTALTFDLQVHEDAHANEDMVPIVYTLCDDNMEFDGDPTNDSVAFDLVTLNPEVLDNQDPASYIVSYYLTQADADAGINPLPVPYNNVTNPQVLYTRVDNNTMVDDGMGNMVDSSDCYATAEVTLEVNPMPAFDLDDNYLLCINTNGTEVINTPAVDTGLSLADGYTFVWFLEGVEQPQYANMPSITPTEGGNYSVVVTSALGCSTTVGDPNTETFVEVSEPPVVTAEITTLAFADQHDIQVTATTTASNAISVYEFSIDGGSWEANTPNDGLYTFSNVEAGEHTITVRDIIGCGETTITITVIDYPQYFTPNGDGYHDTWNILGLAGQPDAIIYIFDRYGKLLKQISPSGAGWNGLYNGNPMANSSYWFTVQYREPTTNEVKTLKAHFALKR